MSKPNDDAGEREHAPSPRKLENARRQGDIAKSTELNAAATYLGLLIAGAVGLGLLGSAAQGLVVLLDQAPQIANLAASGARPVIAGLLATALAPLALLIGLPVIACLLSLITQRAVVFVPDKLGFKLSRISPLASAKHKFGPDGLFEFGKSLVKLVLVSVILGWLLVGNAPALLATSGLDPRLGLGFLYDLLGHFLIIVSVVTAVMGSVDFLWQQQSLIRRNRMSRKDLVDEMKESEGDPQAKAQRRQRGQDLAMNQMIAAVAGANVVIVNPTHYAVALKWHRGSQRAPVLVAKGVDDVARRIREKAAEHGIPLRSDPATARAIHANVDIGQSIQPDQFRAVASAIRFAETMRKRAKGLF